MPTEPKNSYLSKLAVSAFLVFFCAHAYAGVTIIRPNLDGTYEDATFTTCTGCAPAGDRYTSVDETTLATADYFNDYDSNGTFVYSTFQMTDPSGSDKITAVRIMASMGTDGTGTYIFRLRSGSTDDDDTQGTMTGTLVAPIVHTSTWTINPFTSQPWQWSDLTNIEAGVGLNTSNNKNSRCFMLWVEIEYNQAPVITNLSAPTGPSSGTILVTYDLSDPENKNCDLTTKSSPNKGVQYSRDGGPWIDAVMGTGGTGETNLAVGTGKKWAWDSVGSNQIINSTASVYVRMVSSDTAGNLSSTATIASAFNVDNAPPAITSEVNFTAMPESGNSNFSLDAAYYEHNPGQNCYAYNLNAGGDTWACPGGGYNETQDPASYQFNVALDGNDMFTAIKSSHTDDAKNSNTSTVSTIYVKPKTPGTPVLSAGKYDRVSVSTGSSGETVTNLYYLIRGTYTANTKWVNSGGTLDTNESSDWVQWTFPVQVTGLAEGTDYWFSVSACNQQAGPSCSAVNSTSTYSVFITTRTNTRPTLTFGSLPSPVSGQISVPYKLIDIDVDISSIPVGQIQYFNGTWNNTTDGAGGDGRTGLASSASPGTNHTYVWNSGADIINSYQTGVKIQIQPYDSKNNSASFIESGTFNVDNKPPVTAGGGDTAFQSEPASGDLTFTLNATFTEDTPERTWFGYKLNGAGSYTGATDERDVVNSSETFTVTLDGNDKFNAIVATHTDKVNFKVTSEIPSGKFVMPKTPNTPTFGSVTPNTIQVNVQTADTASSPNLYYVIRSTYNDGATQIRYVKSDGTLDTVENNCWVQWSNPVTVTGLVAGRQYSFSVKAGNPQDADLTTNDNSVTGYGLSGNKTTSSKPSVSVINAMPAVSSGTVTITYTLVDADNETCNINQTGTSGIEFSLDHSGWTDASGSPLTGLACTLAGTPHTFSWNTVTNSITYDASVWIQIRPNDSVYDADSWAEIAASFAIDNTVPTVAGIAHFEAEPKSGDLNFSLHASFNEDSPNTNLFEYRLNGAGYTGGYGDANTSAPIAKQFTVTLDSNDYFDAIKVTHVDDVNFTVNTEVTTIKYVQPKTPQAPTVDTPTDTTLKVTINQAVGEGIAVYYAIKAYSAVNGTQYVQSNKTLGTSPFWQTLAAWGTITVTGLETGTNYNFYVSAGNPIDPTPTTAENSASSYSPVGSNSTSGTARPISIIDGTINFSGNFDVR